MKMKKKVIAVLLAVSFVISVTACAGNGQDIEPVMQEQEPKEEPEMEEESEPEDEIESEEEEAEEEPEVEEKVESNVKPAANTPSELSDDLYDFQVSIDGVVYQIPMWYSDFEALGWVFDEDATLTLSSNQHTLSNRWKKDGFSVLTSFANLSMNTVDLTNSMVASLKLDSFYLRDCTWEILLPGGIQWGVSSADDIKAAYGEPTRDYDGENYYQMTYQYDNYRQIRLQVDKESNALNDIEIENIVALEGADNSVDETVPDAVKAYQAPSSLGDDLYSFNVELEGNLYTLPCPVSELLENGFRLNEEDSDEAVASGNSGWVSLNYNNQTLRVLAKNYAEYATTIENCFMTKVESSDNGPKFELTIPGNIKRGDSEADVEKAVKNFNVKEETSDSGFTYYTIYDLNGSSLDHYQIIVKDGVVMKIEVSNSPKKLD
ncbi:MAG: hypothetical protein J1F41_03830 [Lachnospiraceae bacterium]|nr:hypothetical protein [Lachnospiraceae bacterium]